MMHRNTTSGDWNIYFGAVAKNFLTANPDSTLSIDVWADVACDNMRNGRSTSSEAALVRTLDTLVPYTWNTIVLTVDDLTGDGRGIIIPGSHALGNWYFDNIVLAA